MKLKKRLGYLSTIMFIPFMINANTNDKCESNGWCYNAPFPEISSISDSCQVNENIYLAGDSGNIAHYNGKEWSLMNTGTDESLEGLHCVNSHDIYATGLRVLVHYNGEKWDEIESDIVNNGDWGKVWSDGNNIVLLPRANDYSAYFDGKQWNEIKFEHYTKIGNVWGSDIEHLYMAGSQKDGIIFRFDGDKWKKEFKLEKFHFTDILGLSNNDIYAVGTDKFFGGYGGKGIVVHFDGKQWGTFTSKDMNGTTIPELGVIYGDNKNIFTCARKKGTIFKFDKKTLVPLELSKELNFGIDTIWRDTIGTLYFTILNESYTSALYSFNKSGLGLMNATLNALFMVGDKAIFAVGEGGTVMKHNGSTWESMESGVSKSLYGVWGTSEDNLYAVGDKNTILHFNGEVWKNNISLGGISKTLHGIWGSAEDDIYVISSNTIYHYDGQAWKPMKVDIKNKNFKSIHGSAKDDIYVSSNDIIIHYDGKEWQPLSKPEKHSTFKFVNLFVTPEGILFATPTSGNKIYMYDQNTWKEIRYPTKNYANTVYFRAIWGSSKNNIYVIGETKKGDGLLLKFDGVTWKDIDTFPHARPRCIVGKDEEVSAIAGHSGMSSVKNREISKIEKANEQLGQEGKYEKTQLHKAVADNNVKLVKEILSRNVEVDVVDKLGRTPLHYAAFRGYIDVATLLLDKGANINAVDKSKQWTPLFFATYMGQKEMIKFLLQKGADETLKDKLGKTADEYGKEK